MATFSVLRTLGGRGLKFSQLVNPHLLKPANTSSCCLVQKVGLKTSSEKNALIPERVYGPPQAGDLHNDIAHWKNERVWMISMVPIIPLSIAFPNPIMDYAVIVTVMFHTYQGFAGACVDYLHGPIIHRVGKAFVTIASAIAFAGFCYLNYADIGFGKTVQKIYKELK